MMRGGIIIATPQQATPTQNSVAKGSERRDIEKEKAQLLSSGQISVGLSKRKNRGVRDNCAGGGWLKRVRKLLASIKSGRFGRQARVVCFFVCFFAFCLLTSITK
jgi:hypothetical protein